MTVYLDIMPNEVTEYAKGLIDNYSYSDYLFAYTDISQYTLILSNEIEESGTDYIAHNPYTLTLYKTNQNHWANYGGVTSGTVTLSNPNHLCIYGTLENTSRLTEKGASYDAQIICFSVCVCFVFWLVSRIFHSIGCGD